MSVVYKKLEEVCEILDSQRIPITAKDRKVGQYPYYGANGLQDYVAEYIFDDELVLLAEDGGNFGSTDRPIAYRVSGKCWVNNHAHVLKAKPCIDIDYLGYSLMFYDTSGLVNGATRQKLTQAAMREMKIPYRNSAEQKEIVRKIDAVFCLIEKRQLELHHLDQLVKSRFVEMFGDPELNPYGWVCLPLSALVTVEPQNGLYKPQSDYVQDSSGVPILRIDAFYNGKVTDFQSLRRLNCSDIERERYLLRENDIVINRVNSIEYLGKCALIRGMLEGTVFESNMMRFHLDESIIDAGFAVHLLCTQYIYKQIINRAKKSVNQASINQGDVMRFQMLVPPLILQRQFVTFVEQVDKSKLAVKQSLEKLETLKKSLMQQYFG